MNMNMEHQYTRLSVSVKTVFLITHFIWLHEKISHTGFSSTNCSK